MKTYQFVLCPFNFIYWKLGWDNSVSTVTKLHVGQLRNSDLVCDRASNWSFPTTSNEVYSPSSLLNCGWFPPEKAYIHPVSSLRRRQPTYSHTHTSLWHHAWPNGQNWLLRNTVKILIFTRIIVYAPKGPTLPSLALTPFILLQHISYRNTHIQNSCNITTPTINELLISLQYE